MGLSLRGRPSGKKGGDCQKTMCRRTASGACWDKQRHQRTSLPDDAEPVKRARPARRGGFPAYHRDMTVLIDTPLWPKHGTVWAHLVSDTSLDELHAFARRAELPPRAFDLDHYDVPVERLSLIHI